MTYNKILYLFTALAFFILSYNGGAKAQTPGGTNLNVELWLSADNVQGGSLPANGAAVSSWIDMSSNNRNFIQNRESNADFNTLPRFKHTGMNYHPAVEFYKSNESSRRNNSRKLISESNFPAKPNDGKAYYTFWVSRLASGSSGYSTVLAFNQSGEDYHGWSGANAIWHQTRGADYVHQSIGRNYGLGIVYRQNGTVSASRTQAQYHDGIARSTAIPNRHLESTGNYPAVIGNSTLRETNAFFGEIQEIIVLSASGNPVIDQTELNKVQSYLAIKYGIAIGSDYNYVDSSNNIIWDKTVAPNYNNDIFGVGRDITTGLYQKQSVSANNSQLIMFLGDQLAAMNSDNTSDLLADKEFLLLGSNKNKQFVPYKYQAGEIFAGGNLPSNSLDQEINLRKGLTYKVQTGATRRNYSDVKLKTDALYVLICPNENFSPSDTRIYAVDAVTGITSVDVAHGEYISFAIFEGVPGGLKSNIELWLSSDYMLGKSENIPTEDQDVTRWLDLSGNNRSFIQNGSQSVPKVSYNGLNYNPAVEFYQDLSGVGDSDDEPALTTADVQRKLISENKFTIDASRSYYTFWVSEVDTEITGGSGTGANKRGIVFTFNGDTPGSNNQGWNLNRPEGSSTVIAMETSTATTLTKHPTEGIKAAIGAMIRPNNTNTPQQQYLNGILNPIDPLAMTSGDHTAVIGNSRTGTTDHPFFGNVQEVVVYSGLQGAVMPEEDLQKIHTYLAVKYGISLDNQDYITSKGIKVWNGDDADTKNDGYKNHVFGLGRDNPSALYVKQSTSSSSPTFTAFVGDELADLNINNTGSLKDDTYIMFGSNGETGLENYRYEAQSSPTFADGNTIDEDVNFRDKNVWKVQLTNTTTFDLKISAPGKYVLVSDDDPTFQPENTYIYKIDISRGCTEVTLKDGQYICFAYFAKGPGGVVDGLRMWLDAGDKDFISVSDGEVSSWRDKSQMSNTRYTYQAVNSANKIPGYDTASVHTNFYPAVNYRVQGEYLSTNKGPASVASPMGYTVFHIVYNDFIKANRSYFMGFGSKISGSAARNPVFGMRGYDNGVRGRLYESSGAGSVQGSQPLFKAGATSINIQTVNRTTKKIRFESNGLSEELTDAAIGNGSKMSGVGVLGGGSAASWQMLGVMAQSIFYEKVLDEEEKKRIYSYLALKYAVTLRMPTAYDYKFSDGTSLWDGTSAPYSTYHNNVAALINDQTSDLFNNVARSTDEGTIITMMVRGHEQGTNGQGESSLLGEDLSALIWGNNGNNNIYDFNVAEKEALCGTMDSKTDKIWMVKKTPNLDKVDVSIRILQGDFGYYVSPGYQIVLLVADDPAKLTSNNWDLAIPSNYLKDLQQQSIDFTFTAETTYFSLGIKALPGACETCDFEGTRKITFNSKNWNPRGSVDKNFNLGDDGSGNDTDFMVNIKTYMEDASVKWYSRYPRNSSQNSLRMRRRGNATYSMITEITPSVAAASKFQIFNLDREGRRYKEVEVYGLCENGMVIPKLSEASSRSSYTITANKARAKRSPTSGYAADRGKLNVSFEFPVEKIFVKEYATGVATGSQDIGLGPIEFSCPAPIPPYSEAGIAFSKQATDTVIYCGPASMVDYTFRIYSANCDRKGVAISDTLPEHLYWDPNLIYIADIAKEDVNFKLTVSDYLVAGDKRILQIDNLTVPGSADPFIFTAQAKFIDDDIVVGNDYENQAWLRTTMIVENMPVEIDPQPSADYYRGDGFKSRTHVKDGGARLSPITVVVEKNRDCYGATNEILITLKVNNPNPDDVTDMLFDVDYNEEFEYVNNSLSSSITGIPTNPTFEMDGGVKVPGLFYLEGFTLPGNTISTFTFKVKAPIKSALEKEFDENGNPIDWDGNILTVPFNEDDQAVVDLLVGYSLDTDMDDYCISSAFVNANGEIIIPFCLSKECIITNRMLQPRIK